MDSFLFFFLFEDDDERSCTVEDIEQMTYLDCVIKVSSNSEIITIEK
jgi:hypothetical protein